MPPKSTSQMVLNTSTTAVFPVTSPVLRSLWMDSSQYSNSHDPIYKGLILPGHNAANLAVEPYPQLDQYPDNLQPYHALVDYFTGVLTAGDATQVTLLHPLPLGARHEVLVEDVPLTTEGLNQVGIFSPQLQGAHLSYTETGVQTSGSEDHDGEERSQVNPQHTPRHPVPQEAYVPTRTTGFAGSDIIDFVVGGEEGIRLSDASEGNWAGFEGRDDRLFFEKDRLQIIIRLHPIGCSPWQSKIHTTDFRKKRRPITRTKLAAEVAKCIRKFIAREKSNGHDGCHARCRWEDVSLKNVFLTRLVRISTASWRPEIFVEQPSVAPQAAALASS